MHLMITKKKYKGKVHKHAKIVKSYRNKEGKSRKKVVVNVGPIESKEDLKYAENILKEMKKAKKVVVLDKIDLGEPKEYGIIYTAEKLWKRFEIDDVIRKTFEKRKIEFNISDSILLLTVSRLYGLKNELETNEWIHDKIYYHTDIQLHHLYKTLDHLVEEKKKFEKFLLEKLKKKANLKVNIVFYDLTSTYFEGDGPKMSVFGKSKDDKLHRKQIVIGLVLCEGFPITHKIWPGNTLDKITLKDAISDLRERFNINKVLFVADRGIFTEANLQELENNDYDYRYILPTKRRRFNLAKELLTKKTKLKARVAKQDGNRKYIVCLNPETRKDRLKELQEIKNNGKKALKKMAKDREGKKKMTKKGKKKLKPFKKYFQWQLSKGKFTYSLKKDVYDYEKDIAGKILFVTTSNLTPTQVLKTYKDLKYIEQTFRILKHIVNVRPVEHSKERRVKGHVFICFLGILLRRLMSKNLAETNKMVKELSGIKAIELNVDDEEYYFRNKLTKQQKKIFKKLDIKPPIKYL